MKIIKVTTEDLIWPSDGFLLSNVHGYKIKDFHQADIVVFDGIVKKNRFDLSKVGEKYEDS